MQRSAPSSHCRAAVVSQPMSGDGRPAVISRREFDRVYHGAVDEVYQHWTPDMQARLAAHCKPWAAFDFCNYLKCSSKRFYLAYRRIAEAGAETVCDIGGFWGAFPLALTELGFQVTMTEALKYYDEAFAALFARIRSAGVTVLDYDPFHADPGDACFDYVTAMAILEHYPHSPRRFMTNFRALMAAGGRGYLDVPNIAYWPKRIGLLRGDSPLPRIGDIYQSEAPFTGHHHEYTMAELLQLAELADLRVTHKSCLNYSLTHTWPSRLVRWPVQTLALTLFPNTRETLAVEVELPDDGSAVRRSAA